jgi:glycerophosphoryl diester phosphodiesterase
MSAPDGRPKVIAHRGSNESEAEHTLAAYVQAIEEGADGLECDVRLTADGHLVCVHDRRVDRTTNARGLVSTMTLAQLDELDASEWKRPWADLDDEVELPERDETGVLTLARLIEVVRDYDHPLDVAIETKHPTRYAGLVERRVVDLLEKQGWNHPGSPARIMSFSGVALTRVQRLAPGLERVFLIEGAVSWGVARGMLAAGCIAGPGIAEIRERPRFAHRLRQGGHRIHVWVVNSADDLGRCLDLGVEAVITDTPGKVLSWLS